MNTERGLLARWSCRGAAAPVFGLAAALSVWPDSAARAESAGPPPRHLASSYEVDLNGPPAGIALAPDGQILIGLAAMSNRQPLGLAILGRIGERVVLERTLSTPGVCFPTSCTRDGRWVIAGQISDGSLVAFDRERIKALSWDLPVGSIDLGPDMGPVFSVVSPDDRTLFVSEEGGAAVAVVDLERARRDGFNAQALVGQVAVGNGPVGLDFSPDGRRLYVTCQSAPRDWGWPDRYDRPRDPTDTSKGTRRVPGGAVVVIDVERARTSPDQAVLARVPGGSDPVRIVLTPKGERALVTDRSANALEIFDVAKLLSDPDHALLAAVPVGSSPVPVAATDRVAFVGNSDRFAKDPRPSTLSIVDLQQAKVIGEIPCGIFPRALVFSSDHRTLYLGNYGSRTLQVIDLRDFAPL